MRAAALVHFVELKRMVGCPPVPLVLATALRHKHNADRRHHSPGMWFRVQNRDRPEPGLVWPGGATDASFTARRSPQPSACGRRLVPDRPTAGIWTRVNADYPGGPVQVRSSAASPNHASFREFWATEHAKEGGGRVHNFPFEACSGFTHVTARRFGPVGQC
jgi:hypothetical protein